MAGGKALVTARGGQVPQHSGSATHVRRGALATPERLTPDINEIMSIDIYVSILKKAFKLSMSLECSKI